MKTSEVDPVVREACESVNRAEVEARLQEAAYLRKSELEAQVLADALEQELTK